MLTDEVRIDADPVVIAAAVRSLATDANTVLSGAAAGTPPGHLEDLDHLLGRIDDLLDGLGPGRLNNLRFWLDGLRRRVLALQE